MKSELKIFTYNLKLHIILVLYSLILTFQCFKWLSKIFRSQNGLIYLLVYVGNKLKLNPRIYYYKQMCITKKQKIFTPQKPMELMLVHNVKSMRGGNTSLLNYEGK